MKTWILALSLLIAVPLFAHADSAAPAAAQASSVAPVQSGVPVVVSAPAPSKAVSTIGNIVNAIPVALPAWILALLGILVELAMRFFPTKDPRSIFILIANVFGLIGSGFMKISSLLDSIVQNLKSDPASKA